jgi:hypothetical protein
MEVPLVRGSIGTRRLLRCRPYIKASRKAIHNFLDVLSALPLPFDYCIKQIVFFFGGKRLRVNKQRRRWQLFIYTRTLSE